MPIKFAPLATPLYRRLETLSVFLFSLSAATGPIFGTVLFVLLLFTPLSIFALLYLGFNFLRDFDQSSRGGRRFSVVRNLAIWKYYCNYFPIKLVKTHELPPAKNYILGYHPHGVISLGAFGAFATEGAGFSKIFPGIVPHLMTLKCK
jgi:hypothetical protein